MPFAFRVASGYFQIDKSASRAYKARNSTPQASQWRPNSGVFSTHREICKLCELCLRFPPGKPVQIIGGLEPRNFAVNVCARLLQVPYRVVGLAARA